MKKTVIFKALAISGVITTSYLTAIAVPYLEDYKEELIASINFSDDDKERFEARKNFLINSAKVLLPAIGSAAATIGSIILLDNEHTKIEAALTAQLLCILDGIGKAKDLGFTLKRHINQEDLPKKKKDEIIVCEPYSGHVFATTEKIINKAIEKANKRLNNYYFVTLNRLLKDIGGKTCNFGDGFGWSCDVERQMDKWKYDGPNLDIRLIPDSKEDNKYFMIEYNVEPTRIWW